MFNSFQPIKQLAANLIRLPDLLPLRKRHICAVGLIFIILAFPHPASALIDVDIGTFVLYTPKKNEDVSRTTDGKPEPGEIYGDKTTSTSFILLRGKMLLLSLKAGFGILSGTEKHVLEKGDDQFKYEFNTLIYEFLLGLPVSDFDVGTFLGIGSKDYTFKKTSLGSKDINKSIGVFEFGLYAAIPIHLSDSFALRVGGSYQVISGSEQNINITDAVGGGSTKYEHTINPSAHIIILTVGLEF